MNPSRIYTADEANAVLATVASLVETLRDAQAVMEARNDEVRASAPTNGGGPAHREFIGASQAAAQAARALHDLAIQVRDPEQGLLDFPAEIEGSPAFLCWRFGEDKVAYWHPRNTGFADRRPL